MEVEPGMDIRGLGSEIVECPRIGRMIEQHGEQFLQRIFTDWEIRFCQDRNHAIAHFARLWAAKVAVLRALGIARGGGIVWRDLEIRDQPNEKPEVRFRGRIKDTVVELGVREILVSMAHTRTYATASVLVCGTAMKSKGETPTA